MNGLNRLFFLKKQARKIKGDLLLLSDPTIVPVFRNSNNLLVKFHDLRPFSVYNDKTLTKLMYKQILGKLQRLNMGIFTTNYMAKEAARYGINPEKKFIIPEPVAPAISPTSHMEKSLVNVESGTITFSYIATDRPYKNIDLFLKIAKQYSSNKKMKFLLLSRLTKKRKALIDRDFGNVTVKEYVEDISTFYGDTDILLYPSLYEGFGRPVVEAMSFGIPVLTNDIQPFREITSGSSLLSSSSFDSWIKNIDIVTEPAGYRKYAERALNRSEYYSPSRFKDRISEMIEQIL